MLIYPHIDPVALHFGPLSVRWYGLMYLVGFAAAWSLGRMRAARPGSGWTREQVDDLIAWGMLGVILGARLGYVLFYDLPVYLDNPAEVFMIWKGGMSFHGGLLGVLACFWLFARKTGKTFFEVSDFIAPFVPIGLCAGRIGNFINGELWGRVSDVPWAMIFPGFEAGPYPRHPSQLYEATLEGLVLFAIMFWFSASPRPRRAVSGLFALGYASARITVEFFREPDAQLGFLFGNWLTMGMILSLPLGLLGAWLLWSAYRRPAAA
ncbi:phosphatidylglycerol:prolipoprotein diacylglycerol transferase [Desulfobaculum xiamenense]|uniref:Phosphatidylglycerol--prolipoprotein diacylglyceryl transferase n=1 Tax=Desulfobaculum xiamenense TaxID=995050 RepID=A0A846QRH9_9BACT|nr:prolipoprotein diacylglyceryl transferase [Desulfobaculum xiamenense]NJB68973.1 phosphatidylglycerol:prolipoprotein diacylglycerol transferase [Desulfobaculum xiamenense]